MLFGEIGLASQADLVQYTPAVTVSAGNWNLLVIIFFHYGHELFSNYLANLYLNQLHRFSKQMTINFKMKVIVCVKKKIKWVLWAPFFIISPQPVGVFKPEYLVFLWFFLHWLPPAPAPAFLAFSDSRYAVWFSFMLNSTMEHNFCCLHPLNRRVACLLFLQQVGVYNKI